QILKKVENDVSFKESIEKEGGLVIGPNSMIVGKSKEMYCAYELIQRVAESLSPALILGETGTGKDLVAQAIHSLKKKQTPFEAIDCGSIPNTLLESELFGVRENYAGMHNKEKQIGQLEEAGTGTLLLDEIGNMEVELQRKLLRVLQEKKFKPLGSRKALPLQAQVLASTNADLESEIHAGHFRSDLYFRLSVFKIILPPLRQRKEDIPLLVRYHLDQHEKQSGRRVEIFPETMEKLIEYHWPGNVRQFLNDLRRVLDTYPSRYLIPEYFDLPSKPLTGQAKMVPVDPSFSACTCRGENTLNQINKNNHGTYKERLAEFQKLTLLAVLEENRWNQTLAAKQLDMNRTQFSRLVNRFGIKTNNTGRKVSSLLS
ncbi:MAG: sigma-54-dependent Fis family transcriptional regulator, partial [Candidatus Manganitrophaceae bacterium]